MPVWEGIEDNSPVADRVWLSRLKDTDEWKPLKKVDCLALNKSFNNSNESQSSSGTTVLIDGGRATADWKGGTITYNYFRSPNLQLTSAVWFLQTAPIPATSSPNANSSTCSDDTEKSYSLIPISDINESDTIEVFYQHAIQETSSFGNGVDTLLKDEVELQNNYKLYISKEAANVYAFKKKPAGWFGKSITLQRGYGPYKVEGEEEELVLGPVQHVVFLIHGIGEALWSREDIGVNSIAQDAKITRLKIHQRLVKEYRQQCQEAEKAGQPKPDPPNRIEVIPIEWYDRVHSSTNSLMMSLQATTLKTIPALRAIANDVVFDVLMYLTPTFCADVLECVTTQITQQYQSFLECHHTFHGKCSLIGHSLGSVIVWDLLSILKAKQTNGSGIIYGNEMSNNFAGYQQYQSSSGELPPMDEVIETAGTWGPSLPKPLEGTLPFKPDFTLFLGSPIGLFLTLRGAHATFESLVESKPAAEIQTADKKADPKQKHKALQRPTIKVSPFTLPSGSIHNIFHPSDPVAYRIEPLLLPQQQPPKGMLDTSNLSLQSSASVTDAVLKNVNDNNNNNNNTNNVKKNNKNVITSGIIPPPLYLTREGQDVRLHVKAMQIGDEIKNKLRESRNSIVSFVSSLTEQAQSVLNQVEQQQQDKNDDIVLLPISPQDLKFPLAGTKNTLGRIDYQLQPRVIDSEYLSAVTAHSSYFQNEDVLDFIMDLATRQKKTTTTLTGTDGQPQQPQQGQAQQQEQQQQSDSN